MIQDSYCYSNRQLFNTFGTSPLNYGLEVMSYVANHVLDNRYYENYTYNKPWTNSPYFRRSIMDQLYRTVKQNYVNQTDINNTCAFSRRSRVPAIKRGTYQDRDGILSPRDMLTDRAFADVVCDYAEVKNYYKKKLVPTNRSFLQDLQWFITTQFNLNSRYCTIESMKALLVNQFGFMIRTRAMMMRYNHIQWTYRVFKYYARVYLHRASSDFFYDVARRNIMVDIGYAPMFNHSVYRYLEHRYLWAVAFNNRRYRNNLYNNLGVQKLYRTYFHMFFNQIITKFTFSVDKKTNKGRKLKQYVYQVCTPSVRAYITSLAPMLILQTNFNISNNEVNGNFTTILQGHLTHQHLSETSNSCYWTAIKKFKLKQYCHMRITTNNPYKGNFLPRYDNNTDFVLTNYLLPKANMHNRYCQNQKNTSVPVINGDDPRFYVYHLRQIAKAVDEQKVTKHFTSELFKQHKIRKQCYNSSAYNFIKIISRSDRQVNLNKKNWYKFNNVNKRSRAGINNIRDRIYTEFYKFYLRNVQKYPKYSISNKVISQVQKPQVLQYYYLKKMSRRQSKYRHKKNIGTLRFNLAYPKYMKLCDGKFIKPLERTPKFKNGVMQLLTFRDDSYHRVLRSLCVQCDRREIIKGLTMVMKNYYFGKGTGIHRYTLAPRVKLMLVNNVQSYFWQLFKLSRLLIDKRTYTLVMTNNQFKELFFSPVDKAHLSFVDKLKSLKKEQKNKYSDSQYIGKYIDKNMIGLYKWIHNRKNQRSKKGGYKAMKVQLLAKKLLNRYHNMFKTHERYKEIKKDLNTRCRLFMVKYVTSIALSIELYNHQQLSKKIDGSYTRKTLSKLFFQYCVVGMKIELNIDTRKIDIEEAKAGISVSDDEMEKLLQIKERILNTIKQSVDTDGCKVIALVDLKKTAESLPSSPEQKKQLLCRVFFINNRNAARRFTHYEIVRLRAQAEYEAPAVFMSKQKKLTTNPFKKYLQDCSFRGYTKGVEETKSAIDKDKQLPTLKEIKTKDIFNELKKEVAELIKLNGTESVREDFAVLTKEINAVVSSLDASHAKN